MLHLPARNPPEQTRQHPKFQNPSLRAISGLVVPPIVITIVEAAAVAAAGTVAVRVTEKAMKAFESDEHEGDEEEN